MAISFDLQISNTKLKIYNSLFILSNFPLAFLNST